MRKRRIVAKDRRGESFDVPSSFSVSALYEAGVLFLLLRSFSYSNRDQPYHGKKRPRLG